MLQSWRKLYLSLLFLTSLIVYGPAVKAQTAAAWSIPAGVPLLTRWAKDVSPSNALVEYPRPQLARDQWLNLNGLWDYQVTDIGATDAPSSYAGRILVPYPIESALSGVMKAFLPNQRLWYHRTFDIPASWSGQEVLLHFGAVDFETRVFVNGHDMGSHKGGYDEFNYDITRALRPGHNDIVVDVVDPTDLSWEIKGKQTLHPGGAAYTATSGIWQTVWLEPVPANHVECLKYVTDSSPAAIHITVAARIFRFALR